MVVMVVEVVVTVKYGRAEWNQMDARLSKRKPNIPRAGLINVTTIFCEQANTIFITKISASVTGNATTA